MKKQTQYLKSKMTLSIYVKGNYEEFHALRWQENKAKQSQFISVQCSAFSVLRQDKEKEFEKTKPISSACIGDGRGGLVVIIFGKLIKMAI